MNFGRSVADPFLFNESNFHFFYGVGNRSSAGKTLRSSTIAAPSTTKVIIVGGQSNQSTSCGTVVYTPVSGSADILNIYDGGIYNGTDPVLGCNVGNTGPSSICTRLADSMISRGKATRCIVVPIAIGGTKYVDWDPATTNTLFGRISTAILRVRARGLEPDAFFWGEGESDAQAVTPAATITTQIQNIVTAIRAAPLSCTAPFYVGLYTMLGGVINGGLGTGTIAGVRKGIADSVSAPLNIILGYDADNNLAAGTRVDPPGTHFGDANLTTAATAWTTLAFP